MYEKALEVLKILNDKGYSSFIVGGYVRDKILGIKSNDIDIATSATPKEIMELFDVINEDCGYGSVKIIYKKVKFDITTFRKDMKYKDARRPVKVKYVKDIKKDLLRRDFTINTLCIDYKGNIIDNLDIIDDINNKVIKTVGNARYRLKEDVLRILRAIRFSSSLDFSIDKDTEKYIIKYGYLLKKLSYNRKKEELSKMFSVCNKEKVRKLLNDYKLVKYLELSNINDIVLCDDILGIWAQLDIIDIYPFTKHEIKQIKDIKYLLSLNNIDNYTLYKYGSYLLSIVCQIKGYNIKEMTKRYNDLVIKDSNDIDFNFSDIPLILNKNPGKYIKDIMKDIELKIINQELVNDNKKITKYIKDNYKND